MLQNTLSLSGIGKPPIPPNYKLSPSDFAFGWEECKRCFYLKVRCGIVQPRMPMPKIFTRIDSLEKGFTAGKRSECIAPGMPSGVIEFGEKWVESTPITLPGRGSPCFIRGKFDTIITLDDGSYAVVDLKTCNARDEHIRLYSRQLHAYAHSLEHAAPGRLTLKPVTRLGLLVFEPNGFGEVSTGTVSLHGPFTWIEISRDQDGFLAFLDQVVAVLDQPEPPPASAACAWCKYRGLVM